MNAKSELERYAQELDPLLANFFTQAADDARNTSPESAEVIEFLSEYTLRKAKRIRPAFIYYTYQMFGGNNLVAARFASMFIEIIHGYLLIHDDVMDQDPIRRGGPSMHKIYEKLYTQRYHAKRDPLHFGESMAITAGDISCHLALDVLTQSDFPAEVKLRALRKAHAQIILTAFGQMHDLITTIKHDVTEADTLFVHEHKTAVYTYETPIAVGALLAGATDEDLLTLREYSIPAGIGFQIQDDILGLFGDEDQTGKPTISDLREGKQTLLMLKALEKGTPSQINVITQALGNPEVTDAQADSVREIVIETGALEHSKSIAREYVQTAKDNLAKRSDWTGVGREFLDGIADYMIERQF